MADKKKTTTKPKVGKPPTLRERITDTSTGGFVGKAVWGPARGPKKK